MASRTLVWTGAAGDGNFDNAANWLDTGTGQPALTPPTSIDFVTFNASAGATVGGTGNAQTLNISGSANWTFDGSVTTTGQATIDGVSGIIDVAGGSWTIGNSLQVGFNSAGNLDLTAGASVSATTINVGQNVGSEGRLTVGGGSTLKISTAAQSANFLVEIGFQGTGTATVTGTNSLLDSNGNPLQIGGGTGGSGSLTVSQGGTVRTGSTDSSNGDSSASVGRLGFGTLTITDPGSTYTAGGFMYAGRGGTAMIVVENHGSLAVTADPNGIGGLSIGTGASVSGQPTGGTGEATVTTSGVLSSTQFINVGGRGVNGTLSVDQGGVVDVGTTLNVGIASLISGVTLGGSGSVTIGNNGTVKITGAPTTTTLAVNIGTSGTGAALLASTGSVAVEGVGARLDTNGGLMAVGTGGTGNLLVSQGGSVVVGTPDSLTTAALSAGRLGVGNITVTDSGSELTSNGFAYIGGAGAGSLTIQNNATMTVGLDASGNGGFSVGGAGSSTSTLLRVGGTGTALVTSSASLISKQNLDVGENGVTGTLTVNNSGTVDIADRIFIGNTVTLAAGATVITSSGTTILTVPTVFTGSGTVDVGSGGTFKSDGPHVQGESSIIVGNGTGSTGTVNVTGAGALMDGGGDRIGIGNDGTGTVTVNGGATAKSGSQFTTDSALYLAGVAGSRGTLTVTDTGSTFAVAGLAQIGLAGTGTLLVENHGTVTAESFDAGTDIGASGTATVTGPGSQLDVTGQFTVGDQGLASLSIGAGGTATAGTIDIGLHAGANGTIDLEGAGATLSVTGAGLNVGDQGQGTLIVGSGATVGVTGTITVGGASAVIGSGGLIDPTDYFNGSITSGALTIDASTEIVNAGTFIAQGGTMELNGALKNASGTLQIASTGVLQLDTVTQSQRVTFLANTGTLTIKDLPDFNANVIVGFQTGNIIALPTAGATSFAYDPPSGIMTLFNAQHSQIGSITFIGSYTQNDFLLQNNELSLLCFLPGTLIATPAGEVPVERLQPGDIVTTLSGAARRITWVGQGSALATRGRRTAATPVIIRKGAFADNIPHHDLRVTKGHSFFLDGVLVPAEFLVNHRSIEWDDRAQEVAVHHIELDTHDVLLANGAPAESYRDDGNRWLFRNANSGWGLPPQDPCAPVLTGGPVVDAIWRRLLDRAGPRHLSSLTDDPDLHLLADGRRVDAARRTGGRWTFLLPNAPSDLRIGSRAASPAELGLARDPRCLGVAIRRIELRRGAHLRLLEADDPRLCHGFHAFEQDNVFRWTDGDAAVPAEALSGLDGAIELELHVASTARYPEDGKAELAA
jgi:T5SS/PEP-CTERM-associated repeat protein